ncbi:class I adenylate-forming enzyme family protein [Hydrogenovibrio halophilus]|uniref:class I adenylate-forming enzyme family protein n=1 Tax=Hydrogenovibrio halophilus TaxID=373391 RepID=UPI00048AB2DA|nr:fatty acid--CoA ligase family protein [Hydrogenovibrio halophilus]
MTDWLTHLQSFADKPAIVDERGTFDYHELVNQIQSFRRHLSKTIDAGQVVAILSDYNFYAVALFFALYEKQAVIVPIVSTRQAEIDKRLAVVDADWVLELNGETLNMTPFASAESHSSQPMINALRTQKEPGLVLFSSGSTGEPKGMVHNLARLVDSVQGKKPKQLNMLVFLMFDHIGGLNTLLNSLAMGARIVLVQARDAEAVAKLIEAHRIHVLPASPTFLNLMLMAKVHERFDMRSLKMITYGTESMPESLLQKLKKAFPKTRLLQTFGTSETGIAQTTSRSSASLEMKLDDPRVQTRVVDGELWLKSDTQIMGYLNAPMDDFTEDGWFRTGDLVEVSEDGYLRIRGRIKEMINVGGEKVLPAEVESVLFELDLIADCMVYGAENAITGEMVCAQIVLAPQADPKSVRRLLRQHCRARLSRFKIPARIEFVDQTHFGDRFKKKRLS